jgi:hypothetical protein
MKIFSFSLCGAALLMLEMEVFANVGHGIFRRTISELYSKLPDVHIVSLVSQYNSTSEDNFPIEPKNVEQLFHHWLNTSYHKYDKIGEHASLFFLFTHFTQTANLQWFNNLDGDLKKFAEQTTLNGFQLDRVFMPYFYNHFLQRKADDGWRNLLDIRALRPDNEWSTNGREVFIPYVIKNTRNVHKDYFPNKLFLTAMCFENNNGMDRKRMWRAKTFLQWKNLSDSFVTNQKNDTEVLVAYHNSDFCVILPGETSSSAELYKAIFAGCIPVIFLSFREQLPFIHYLDWSKFSIIVVKDIINSEKDMKSLVLLLQNIRQNLSLLEAYKRSVREAASLFDYNRIEWPSVYHLTLLELTHGRQCGNVARGSFFDQYQQSNTKNATSNLRRFIC